jgi:hypothetical protein
MRAEAEMRDLIGQNLGNLYGDLQKSDGGIGDKPFPKITASLRHLADDIDAGDPAALLMAHLIASGEPTRWVDPETEKLARDVNVGPIGCRYTDELVFVDAT